MQLYDLNHTSACCIVQKLEEHLFPEPLLWLHKSATGKNKQATLWNIKMGRMWFLDSWMRCYKSIIAQDEHNHFLSAAPYFYPSLSMNIFTLLFSPERAPGANNI